MAMYVYYQKDGGNDPWVPIQAHLSLDEIKPTFVTVLATDTLIDSSTPNELKMKAKYQGPMYFDLDSSDITESIADAKLLVARLMELELQASDMLIYLSGKKGLHILVPDVCFMSKSQPVTGLVAVYKEVAFQLAVHTMDFRVYTAKRGRQFRTTYNRRENGNYKVQITVDELNSLTAETYATLCSNPRPALAGHNPQWRGRFAIMYDSALQKIGKIKPKATKPTPPAVLAEQLPIFNKLATGSANTVGGFNVIAMQLALYARESKWDEETLIRSCRGVLDNHQSDGSRYNSPRRREAELRRMFYYLEDNPSFEYSVHGIKSCFPKAAPKPAREEQLDYTDGADNFDYPVDEGDDEVEQADFAGVYAGSTVYMVSKGEDGDVPLCNFKFTKTEVLRDIATGAILGISTVMRANNKPSHIDISPSSFTGGAALQNAVSSFGGSFSGTDIHARGIYQAMLREVEKDSYVVTSEGINLLNIGTGTQKKQQYVVWADYEGIRSAESFSDKGLSVAFHGFPDPKGNIKTDMLSAPSIDSLLETSEGRERFINCIKNFVSSHTPEVMGKIFGWAAAAFYAPIFHHHIRKFPLLHVYGPAGNGKTETVHGMLRMFYLGADAAQATPNSSSFSIQQLFGSSSSIPVLLDEFKPHTMDKPKLDALRAMLRDAYNAKEVQRGGGNRTSSHFGALTGVKLAAPVVFVAEAPETETALVERSVMVSFRRLAGKQQAHAYQSAMAFYKDTAPLTALGLEIATSVVAQNNADESIAPFNKYLAWASDKFLPSPDDSEKVSEGKMTVEEARLRSIMRPRTVNNSTVAFFGLSVVKRILIEKLGEADYTENFGDIFTAMSRNVFVGMDALAVASLPEFVKVLTIMSEMSRMDPLEMHALREGLEYNLAELGGRTVIVLAVPQAYRRYRAHMKATGGVSLYPSEDSFQVALREIPQFVQTGKGTKRLDVPTMVLFSDELIAAGMTPWAGKVQAMTL